MQCEVQIKIPVSRQALQSRQARDQERSVPAPTPRHQTEEQEWWAQTPMSRRLMREQMWSEQVPTPSIRRRLRSGVSRQLGDALRLENNVPDRNGKSTPGVGAGQQSHWNASSDWHRWSSWSICGEDERWSSWSPWSRLCCNEPKSTSTRAHLQSGTGASQKSPGVDYRPTLKPWLSTTVRSEKHGMLLWRALTGGDAELLTSHFRDEELLRWNAGQKIFVVLAKALNTHQCV